MKKKRRHGPVAPFYLVALIWILFSMFQPVYGMGRLLTVIVISAAAFVAAMLLCKSAAKDEPVEEEPEKEEEPAPAKSYGSEIDAIIAEGARAQQELGRLYASIPDLEVKRKIRDIMEVSDKIIEDAKDDPKDVPQIKKFLDYYLPTTIKLLNAYDRMGAQGIEGANISGTMKNINEMLDTAIDAYHKLLDSLFANQALDIETDIEVMNTLLKREGFSAGSAGM